MRNRYTWIVIGSSIIYTLVAAVGVLFGGLLARVGVDPSGVCRAALILIGLDVAAVVVIRYCYQAELRESLRKDRDDE